MPQPTPTTSDFFPATYDVPFLPVLVFALLCPVLIWPLYSTLRKYGFRRSTYVSWSLLGYLCGGLIAHLLQDLFRWPTGTVEGCMAGVILVWVIHVIIGSESSTSRTRERQADNEAVEAWEREVLETADDDPDPELVCIKAYQGDHQQFEFQHDFAALQAAGIRALVRGAGVTTLLVQADQVDRALAVLEPEAQAGESDEDASVIG